MSWLLLAAQAGWAVPVHAQIAAALSVDSDYRHRGYSLSDGRPAATASVYYDDPDGIYFGGSATGVLTHDGPELLSLQGNLGYARRLGPELTIDAGMLSARYFESYTGRRNANYSEIYVGVITPHIQSRLYFSPDYFRSGAKTLYGEVDGSIGIGHDIRLSGHVGALTYLEGYSAYQPRTRYDWRVGASRPFGPLELRLAVSGRKASGHYYRRSSSDAAIVIGASYAF